MHRPSTAERQRSRIRALFLVLLVLTAPGVQAQPLRPHASVGRGQPTSYTGVVSPDLRWAASFGEQGALWLWNAATGQPVWTFPRPYGEQARGGSARPLAFSPDGRLLAVASANSSDVWVLEVPSARQVAHFVHGRKGRVASPFGEYLRAGDFPAQVAFSPDGSVLAGEANGHVIAWDVRSRDTLWSAWVRADVPGRTSPELVEDMAFQPGGGLLALATLSGTVELYDGRTGTPAGRLFVEHQDATSIAFSPDGTLVALDTCGQVDVWSMGERLRVASLPVGRCGHQLAISPDNRLLVGGSGYAGHHVWDLRSTEPVQVLYAPEQPPSVLAYRFSADGTRLMELVGGGAYRVRTWAVSGEGAP
ncbi:MAG TPA: PQQ-binding-like beta-propeller repeat protein [Longimicrobium sp.]|nr:PQQ-binding-like beta-propeller repeat protein [Longimicrobium sp.]